MKAVIIVPILFFITSYVPAQVFVNPGIKIGYAFGKDGGFVFGCELSVTNVEPNIIWGVVIDYDNIKDLRRLHVGVEFSRAFIGMDFGPTFAWENGKSFTGFSIIPFTGFFIYPYYNFTYLHEKGSIHEAGSYLKFSIGHANIKLQ